MKLSDLPGGGEESGHDPVLLGPRVDDGVDEVVARPLLRHGRAPARKEGTRGGDDMTSASHVEAPKYHLIWGPPYGLYVIWWSLFLLPQLAGILG